MTAAPTTREELEQFLADQIRPIEDGEEGWIDAAKRILAALDDRMVEAAATAIFDIAPFRSTSGPWEDQTPEYQKLCHIYAKAALRAGLKAAGE